VFRDSTVNDENVTDIYQFWLFFLLMIISWVSMAVVVSVGDAICFEMLGKLACSEMVLGGGGGMVI